MMAKVLMRREGKVKADNSIFRETCFDVLGSDSLKIEDIRKVVEARLR